MRTFRTTLVATAAALLVACAGHPATTPDVASRANRIAAQNSTLDWLTGYLASPHAPVADEPAVLAGAGDVAQQTWLAADLAAHASTQCTIAYFHHPRFSSGMHGNHFQMQKIWDLFYLYGVDLVVSGHDHMYERFGPQNPDGQADDAFGIRQFTAGTGGAEFYAVSQVQPNSEVIINDTHASWCSHWIRTTTRGRSRAWIARSRIPAAVPVTPRRRQTNTSQQ